MFRCMGRYLYGCHLGGWELSLGRTKFLVANALLRKMLKHVQISASDSFSLASALYYLAFMFLAQEESDLALQTFQVAVHYNHLCLDPRDEKETAEIQHAFTLARLEWSRDVLRRGNTCLTTLSPMYVPSS